jgi:hypothetical protein
MKSRLQQHAHRVIARFPIRLQRYSCQPFLPLCLRCSTSDCKVSANKPEKSIRFSEEEMFQNCDLAQFSYRSDEFV